VILRLSDSRNAAAVEAARAHVADRLNTVKAEISECEALQEDLSERLGRREHTRKTFGRANQLLAKTLADLYAERDLLDDLGATPAPVCCGSTTGRECAQPDACAAQAHHRSEVGKEQMHPASKLTTWSPRCAASKLCETLEQ
jgi:hypothetical protein